MAKNSRSAAVKASREAAGRRSRSVYLTDEETERWRAVAEARGETLTEAFMAGIAALESGGKTSPEEALRVLDRLVKEKRR